MSHPLPKPEDLGGALVELSRVVQGGRALLICREAGRHVVVTVQLAPDGSVDRFGSIFRCPLRELSKAIDVALERSAARESI